MKIYNTEITDYQGLGRAILLADHKYELVVTLDVGPRIMRFSRLQHDNILAEKLQETSTLPDGSIWNLYGGHRIWHSPEQFPRTYLSDNQPVENLEIFDWGISIWQKIETWTYIQKGLSIVFRDDSVEVKNIIRNCGAWPIEIAIWAITVLPPQGFAICPVVQQDTGLLPNACYVTWPYTRLNDRRVNWGEKYIKVYSDSQMKDGFKFGYSNVNGWLAYKLNENLFVKQYHHHKGASYPDYGCSSEVYTSYFGLELETLSPLSKLEPNQIIEHNEFWHIMQLTGDLSFDNFQFSVPILNF